MKNFVELRKGEKKIKVDFNLFLRYEESKCRFNVDMTNTRKAVLSTAIPKETLEIMTENYQRLKKHFDKLKMLYGKPYWEKTT